MSIGGTCTHVQPPFPNLLSRQRALNALHLMTFSRSIMFIGYRWYKRPYKHVFAMRWTRILSVSFEVVLLFRFVSDLLTPFKFRKDGLRSPTYSYTLFPFQRRPLMSATFLQPFTSQPGIHRSYLRKLILTHLKTFSMGTAAWKVRVVHPMAA
jgi:hypothetical protein